MSAELPAKIITPEDFTQCCKVFPTITRSSDKNQLAIKMEEYIRKHIVELTDSKDKKESLPKLVQLLMEVQRDLPHAEFFTAHGQDLFNIFFKVTYYDKNIEHSVHNLL